mgnify:CR=1 FL=1|jgi:hypothetical protein
MRYKIFALLSILSFSIIFVACGGDQPAANSNAANTKSASNTAANDAGNAVATTKKPEAETTNDAPTLAPVVAAYYEALKKKDDAALRKVFSAETIKSLEADMKSENKTSLAEFITELEPAPEKPFEVRNEKITGDTGIAEIRGGSLGVWTAIKFVKENGEWKMTNESTDFDAVKKDAESENKAK